MTDRAVKKLVFGYADETCPAVDSWFDHLIDELIEQYGTDSTAQAEHITRLVDHCRDRVKADGTILLRDAMYNMADDMISLESKLQEAEARNGS